MFDSKLFGKKVRYYRKYKGLTLNKLSEEVGIELNSLANIEYGLTSPPISTIVRIMKELDVTYTCLTTEQNDDESLIETILSKAKRLSPRDMKLLICFARNM